MEVRARPIYTPQKRGAKIAKWLADQKMRKEEALIAEAMRYAAAPETPRLVAPPPRSLEDAMLQHILANRRHAIGAVLQSGSNASLGQGRGQSSAAGAATSTNDCHEFAQSLVDDIGSFTEPEDLTRYWMDLALSGVGRRKHSVTGFKPELVASGQDSDVYRHIHSNAGAEMLGILGLPRKFAHAIDDTSGSLFSRSPERRGEERAGLAGNSAGARVGRIVLGAFDGSASMRSILNEIKNELCQ